MEIRISKGLDIPITGKPHGNISQETDPQKIALNLEPFDLRFHLLAKVGDRVKIGSPIAEDKMSPGRYFVSPASGTIIEIQRGLKRALRNIIIQVDTQEAYHEFSGTHQLMDQMKEGGIFSKIMMRPFNRLANPEKPPTAIFVKALESAPFTPRAELQVQGYEKAFQTGLTALAKIAPVHLVYDANSSYHPFTHAQDVEKHTAIGPHPISNPSVHIAHIKPIKKVEDLIWTLNAHDVTCLGHLLLEGKIRTDRVVAIAGPGILPDRTGYFRLREGFPISQLIANRIAKGPVRLISGDPLMGHKVFESDFLGFADFVLTAIPENTHREFLHFFRAGLNKYSFSRAYLSAHFNHSDYNFTTSLHGEHRAFIDSTQIDKVQPLPISTMLLVKAIMAEDFDLAEKLGILEVAPEDFALPTFVCPSKVEMVDIVKSGLQRYSRELI